VKLGGWKVVPQEEPVAKEWCNAPTGLHMTPAAESVKFWSFDKIYLIL